MIEPESVTGDLPVAGPGTDRAATLFACPTCAAPLAEGAADYRCPQGHSVDKARQGYVNLLPTGRQRVSGDNAGSVNARRAFHARDPYRPLTAAMAALLDSAEHPAVLDAGCGEGYYLRQLATALGWRREQTYGVDISKAAVRAAAGQGGDRARYAVANTYRLPVLPESVGVLIKVFAPLAAGELLRVVRAGALVLEVLPGPQHLKELRELLYADYRPHADTTANAAGPAAGLPLAQRRQVSYEMTLPMQQRRDLITMTPYLYRSGDTDVAELADRLPVITADFDARLYVRP
jgi:23S rRNA (guanine745-N1)-methyltransferase